MPTESATASVDTHDEKALAKSPPVKSGFFSRSKNNNINEKPLSPVPEEAKSPATTPVPLLDLFRFSTRSEIVLDIIGLVCAAGAGAAQVSWAFSFEVDQLTFILMLFYDSR